jgi:hypothetical protein
MNLFLSACEFGRWIPDYDLDVLIPPTLERLEPRVAGLTPARAARVADRLLFDEAVSCAAADPLRFTGGVLRRAALTFSPRLMPVHPRGPDAETVRVDGRLELRAMPERARWTEWVHGIATSALLLAAIAGMLSGHVARSAMLALTIGVLALTNGLFMVSTRLASPTYLVLMIFAGAAFARRR